VGSLHLCTSPCDNSANQVCAALRRVPPFTLHCCRTAARCFQPALLAACPNDATMAPMPEVSMAADTCCSMPAHCLCIAGSCTAGDREQLAECTAAAGKPAFQVTHRHTAARLCACVHRARRAAGAEDPLRRCPCSLWRHGRLPAPLRLWMPTSTPVTAGSSFAGNHCSKRCQHHASQPRPCIPLPNQSD
jgi:hypothetical protein